MEDTQIKQLMRTIGALQANIGLKTALKNLPVIERKQITGKQVLDSLVKLGINGVNVVQQDSIYYSTSWEEYQVVLKMVWEIIKNIPYVPETGDCDNRAHFVNFLCGQAGLNTCSVSHCTRKNIDNAGYNGGHLTNVIIDKDGNTYLFDVDNHGLMQKIDGNNAIMGREKYTFDGARVL